MLIEGQSVVNKTPSILTCSSCFKTISSVHSDMLHLSILLDDNNINWNLDGFACKPFTRKNYTIVLLHSVSKFETTSWTHGEAVDMELSSAELYNEHWSTKWNMYLTKILKSKGPRIEPCGTHFLFYITPFTSSSFNFDSLMFIT